MFNFLREGGLPFMFAILLVGGAGVFILVRHAFRWFILRDHTRQSLSSCCWLAGNAEKIFAERERKLTEARQRRKELRQKERAAANTAMQ